MVTNSALATIYAEARDDVLRYLMAIWGLEPADAEDVWHAVILKFRAAYDPARGRGFTLLIQISKRLAYNLRRDRKRAAAALEKLPEPISSLDQLEGMVQTEATLVARARILARLRGRDYTVCRLWLDGHPAVEIASLVGGSRSGVYAILRRVREEL